MEANLHIAELRPKPLKHLSVQSTKSALTTYNYMEVLKQIEWLKPELSFSGLLLLPPILLFVGRVWGLLLTNHLARRF